MPPVVKNLLIINGLFFLASMVLADRFQFSLSNALGMFNWESPSFRPYQLVTHFFMHGDFPHILSNMFALWMFGSVLENTWGSKRFLIYYLFTALGAAVLHQVINTVEIYNLKQHLDPETIEMVKRDGRELLLSSRNYIDKDAGSLNLALNIPTVGASGAVFGVLLAFGMLFPNTLLYLYFAIPVKAKYFVAGYGLIELYLGIQNNPGDNIAHFAHLGGMLFGFILLKYWNKNDRKSFY